MNRYEAYKKTKDIIDKGFPINSDELEYLVLCLSNINSRAYDEVIEYLKAIGEPIIPYVKKNLSVSGEGEFHSSLLHTIVQEWPKEWVEKIESELIELAWYGDQNWGVDLNAIEILIKSGIAKKERLTSLINRKIKGCEHYRKSLENLKKLLEDIN